jgi:hypothetical protein
MASTYQIEINRRNAAQSTGPRNPEGKERSRLNALRHGATSRLLVLPGENPQDLDQLRAALIDSFQPEDSVEATLVERAVECWHFLGRSLRAQQARLEQQMRQAERLEQAQE